MKGTTLPMTVCTCWASYQSFWHYVRTGKHDRDCLSLS